jgi:hypothetical protein
MSPIDFAQLYLSRRAQSQEPAAQGEAEANGKG